MELCNAQSILMTSSTPLHGVKSSHHRMVSSPTAFVHRVPDPPLPPLPLQLRSTYLWSRKSLNIPQSIWSKITVMNKALHHKRSIDLAHSNPKIKQFCLLPSLCPMRLFVFHALE